MNELNIKQISNGYLCKHTHYESFEGMLITDEIFCKDIKEVKQLVNKLK